MFTDWKDYSQNNGFDVEENVQMIYGTFDREITKPITLSTWQSQNSERKKEDYNHFNNLFDAILQDECHKATAGSITSILEACSDIGYRMGFTGSLKKSKTNKMQLEGLLGKVFKPITTRELIDRGELANIDIKLIMLQYGKEVHKALKETKYQDQIQWILNHSGRNKFIINLAATQKGNKLVLFHSEDHGKFLMKMCNELYPDVQTFFINGGIDTEDREIIRKKIEGLESSITFGSFGTVSQGWSVKNLHNLILAHPWKAPIKIIQSIGRVLRISKTKNSCNMFDICDIITKGKRDYLKRHAQERVEIYISEDLIFKTFEIPIKTTI
jgi:superfamily II DNA or RNA helicase